MNSSDRADALSGQSERRYAVVAYAPNPWNGPWMNRQQILSRLGKCATVVYSNGPWFVWNRQSSEVRNANIRGSFAFADNIWLDQPSRVALRWPKLKRWDKAVLHAHARRLRQFAADDADGPLIAYAFHPHFVDELRALKPDYIVYHAYDLFERTAGWTSKSSKSQKWLLENADAVIASSPVIAESLREIHNRQIDVIPNGVDFQTFSSGARDHQGIAESLAEIPHPRIGYIGRLNQKVDFQLIDQLAARQPLWNFVFVGQVGRLDAVTKPAYDRCSARRNVHFVGHHSLANLPSCMESMDVNIMCYRIDPSIWTAGIYPLKLHEYLAVGKPVVAADIAAIREFAEVIAIASSLDEWERALKDAISNGGRGTPALRRATAKRNDWNARVISVKQVLQRVIS